MASSGLLSTAEVAARLGITARAVRDAAQRGSLHIALTIGTGNRASHFFAEAAVSHYAAFFSGKPGRKKPLSGAFVYSP